MVVKECLRVFQETFKGVPECLKCLSRKLKENFPGVSRKFHVACFIPATQAEGRVCLRRRKKRLGHGPKFTPFL